MWFCYARFDKKISEGSFLLVEGKLKKQSGVFYESSTRLLLRAEVSDFSVPSGDGGSGDTHGRQRRPGSARRTHGATGDQPNRAEMARMNVINGEMTVVRGALFQDADAALVCFTCFYHYFVIKLHVANLRD